MATEAQVDRDVVGGFEFGEDVRVEQLGAADDAVFGLVTQVRAGGVLGLEVAEIIAAGEASKIAIAQLEVVGTFEQLGDPAFLVIEVTIVGVDGGLQAGDAIVGVRRGVVDGAGILQAVHGADRDSGVEAALELAVSELEGVPRRGGGKNREGGDGRHAEAAGGDDTVH